jgi:hypothetical protein
MEEIVNIKNEQVDLLYVETTISSEHLKELKELSKTILDDTTKFKKHNHKLAGHIEKEFLLGDKQKILEPYIKSLVNLYSDEEQQYDFSEGWINFQKKYEFNPLHQHSGDYSYVLWVQIPYDLEKELSLPNSKNANGPVNSVFEFVYSGINGYVQLKNLFVDKSWEGKLILFPAWLKHQVYPFYTSDDYRISIAGNVRTLKNMATSRQSFDYG